MSDPVGIRVASFYYDEAKLRLAQRRRILMPWHKEDDPHDPIVAMEDQEAYRMGRDASLHDMAATELTWATARRRSSMIAAGKPIGYRLAADIPARVSILARLTSIPALPATLVPQGALFSTEGDDDTAGVEFEADEDLAPAATTMVVYYDATAHDLYIGHLTLQFAAVAYTAAVYASGLGFQPQYWDSVARDWHIITGATDGTAHLTGPGTVSWSIDTLHDADHAWGKTTVNGVEAYWMRMRLAAVVGPITDPTGSAAAQSGSWYVYLPCTQGQTVTDILGTTASGAAWQRFYFTKGPYIEDSLDLLAVGTDLTWTRATEDSFYLASAADKVYVVGEDSGGYYVQFGDGTNGTIPPDGSQVEARYRVGADEDGNVGADTVTINRSSVARLADIRNPRTATGWIAAEASTEESLARTREIAPATQRALGRAVSLEDHETLATRWRSEDGRQPVARAYAVRDGSGPRSVLLLLVGAAGALVLDDDVDALDLYYNGEVVGTQRVGGVAMMGATVTPQNYTRKTITIAATMRVLTKYASTAKVAAEAAIAAALGPLTLESDEATWAYYPGGKVGVDRLKGAGVAVVPGFVDYTAFTLNGAGDLTLAATELPGTVTVTVTVVEV